MFSTTWLVYCPLESVSMEITPPWHRAYTNQTLFHFHMLVGKPWSPLPRPQQHSVWEQISSVLCLSLEKFVIIQGQHCSHEDGKVWKVLHIVQWLPWRNSAQFLSKAWNSFQKPSKIKHMPTLLWCARKHRGLNIAAFASPVLSVTT